MIKLQSKNTQLNVDLKIGGSKSESNRLLILQALAEEKFTIENLSNSKDTQLMLASLKNDDEVINIGMAGTAMRFLTAYYSIQEGRETLLTGSERMKQRPIGELVEALRSLGADIQYEENEGYPPLRIKGKKLNGGKVNLDSSVSSQFITALMLIGPKLKKGLSLKLKGKTVSKPYILMTSQLLEKLGVSVELKKNTINIVNGQIYSTQPMVVESDWSSASYHYSIAAASSECDIKLSSYRRESFQGDSALSEIYKQFGISTIFLNNKIRLIKESIFNKPESLEIDLVEQPDIAQTIAVTAFIMGIKLKLTGLETLRIKETDRLFALKVELEKLGAEVDITMDTLILNPVSPVKNDVHIDTYDDHRMAMAFAPIAVNNSVFIENPSVVEKSYPNFWEHLEDYKFEILTK
jgi:3-phosphoshikimate 1-carboxyvinyltransferase